MGHLVLVSEMQLEPLSLCSSRNSIAYCRDGHGVWETCQGAAGDVGLLHESYVQDQL